MLKLIYLFNNFHLNKISLSFMFISAILVFISVYYSIELDLNNLEDLRNYNNIKLNFLYENYTILEIIISMFVIILSFMELYNNAHLFDVVLIAKHKKYKVLAAKIISYLVIVVIYVTIVFIISTCLSIVMFKDNTLIKDFFIIYVYSLLVSLLILFLSLILLSLFKNYFASFILLLIVILKRIILEIDNDNLLELIPYIITKNGVQISVSLVQTIAYVLVLIILSIFIYKNKDIKT